MRAMRPLPLRRTKLFAAVFVLLAGCASAPAPESTPETAPESPLPPPQAAPAPEAPAAPAAKAPGTESVAVAGLMERARVDTAAGKVAQAAAALERALRIEPRNPRLWQALARVRLKQGEYGQAESTAARSNSWAGDDNALRAENWRLIAQAREARGDSAGAQAASDTADRISP